jgi:hypothetical protein
MVAKRGSGSQFEQPMLLVSNYRHVSRLRQIAQGNRKLFTAKQPEKGNQLRGGESLRFVGSRTSKTVWLPAENSFVARILPLTGVSHVPPLELEPQRA